MKKKTTKKKVITGKFEYNLADPYEKEEFELLLKAPELSIKVWDFYHEVIRSLYKYGGSGNFIVDQSDDKQAEILEYIRKEYVERFGDFI